MAHDAQDDPGWDDCPRCVGEVVEGALHWRGGRVARTLAEGFLQRLQEVKHQWLQLAGAGGEMVSGAGFD